jgi:hypothetical protein
MLDPSQYCKWEIAWFYIQIEGNFRRVQKLGNLFQKRVGPTHHFVFLEGMAGYVDVPA